MSDILRTAGLVIALNAPSPAAQDSVSADRAIEIVRPIYNALTAASPEDLRIHLESGTTKDWQNCGSTDACDDREATIARWNARIAKVPDFRFEIRDVVTMGNRIVVRSEARGTPVGQFRCRPVRSRLPDHDHRCPRSSRWQSSPDISRRRLGARGAPAARPGLRRATPAHAV